MQKTSLLLLFLMVFVNNLSPAQEAPSSSIYQKLAAFNEVVDLLLQKYIEPVEAEILIEAAIQEMVSSLDPHSYYLSDPETAENEGGIGIITTIENGVMEIIEVIEESPAFKANLKTHDQILAVDQQPVNSGNFDQVGSYIRGPIDTKVTLRIKRQDQATFEIEIIRQPIPLKTSYSRLFNENIGYLAITTFTGSFPQAVYQEFHQQLAQIKQRAGPNLQGLILDLRDNFGGWIEEAIYIADAFLDQGEIVSIHSPNRNQWERYQAKPGDLINGLPIIILVNHNTASSAEILTAALSENKRALVIGTRTYGKATVWRQFDLDNQKSVQLTTEFAYGPSGRSWQLGGIIPDLLIEQGTLTTMPALREGVEESYKNVLPNPFDKNNQPPVSLPLYLPKADLQLREAILLMRGFQLLQNRH